MIDCCILAGAGTWGSQKPGKARISRIFPYGMVIAGIAVAAPKDGMSVRAKEGERISSEIRVV